jgi:hypothetical protein
LTGTNRCNRHSLSLGLNLSGTNDKKNKKQGLANLRKNKKPKPTAPNRPQQSTIEGIMNTLAEEKPLFECPSSLRSCHRTGENCVFRCRSDPGSTQESLRKARAPYLLAVFSERRPFLFSTRNVDPVSVGVFVFWGTHLLGIGSLLCVGWRAQN